MGWEDPIIELKIPVYNGKRNAVKRPYTFLNKDKKDNLPSDEVILKYKNFNQLRRTYEDITKRPAQPLYKNRKLYMLLLLIGLTIWMMYEYNEEQKKEQQDSPTPVEETK